MKDQKTPQSDIRELYNEKGPIGYWVKRTNDVFTNLTRKTPDHGSFNRVEWQLLSTIHEKAHLTTPEVIAFLSFFTTESEIQKVIRRFETESLIKISRENITITEKGEQVYEEVLEIQEEILQKAMYKISAEEYKTTINTLQKIIENLKDYTA